MFWKTVSVALLLVHLTLINAGTINTSQSEVSHKQEISANLPETLKLYSIIKQLFSFANDVEKLKKQLNEAKLEIEELKKEKLEIENERNLTLTQMKDVTKLLASVQVENENLKKELDGNEQVKEVEKLRKEKIELEAEKNITMNFGTNLQGIEETLKIMEAKQKSEAASDTSKNAVENGYILTEGKGYHKIYTEAQNWNDARKTCNADGAHLAIINSEAEEKLLIDMYYTVQNMVENANHPSFPQQIYIGIHDLFEEGEWTTVLGEPLNKSGYVHWSNDMGGQPNNYGGQNCGTLDVEGEIGMNDVECSYRFAYVCEIPI